MLGCRMSDTRSQNERLTLFIKSAPFFVLAILTVVIYASGVARLGYKNEEIGRTRRPHHIRLPNAVLLQKESQWSSPCEV